jgi:hypothetical protein
MYGGALRYLTRADIVRAFHYHRRDFPRRFFYEAPCQEIISGIKDQKRFELPFLIRAFIRIVPFGTQKELCHFFAATRSGQAAPAKLSSYSIDKLFSRHSSATLL